MEKQKRERNTNFSHNETILLVSLVEAKKHIIENKKSDANTWQEKEKAWKDIEKAFNSSAGLVFRDHKHLKLKYEAMKRDTRKKSAIVRSERYKTGGGTNKAPLLTIAEEKVKEMILLSVDGNESQFDSDLVLPSTSTSVITGLPNDEQQRDQQPTEMLLTDDLSENLIIELVEQESEPPKKKACFESQKEIPLQNNIITEKKWKKWNPMALKTKKHPILSKQKEKWTFEKLTEEKLEIAKIQKQLIMEEFEQKLIQRKILEKELEQKDTLYELEKQHLLLKIKLLKKELGEI